METNSRKASKVSGSLGLLKMTDCSLLTLVPVSLPSLMTTAYEAEPRLQLASKTSSGQMAKSSEGLRPSASCTQTRSPSL